MISETKKSRKTWGKAPDLEVKDRRVAKAVATYGWGSDVEAIVEALGGDLISVHDVAKAEALKDTIDLVILQGGTDISPMIYGQKDEGKCQHPDVNRDNVELTLLEAALHRNLPIMGICRGNQMIAAAFGGTLHQDVPGHGYSRHKVTWMAGNRLQYSVNSLHHQAVDEVPPDFEILARAEDGTIEGIFSSKYRAMGVQFHPEMMAENEEGWLSLFQYWYAGYNGKLAPIHKVKWYSTNVSKWSNYGRGRSYGIYGDWDDYEEGYYKTGTTQTGNYKTYGTKGKDNKDKSLVVYNSYGGTVTKAKSKSEDYSVDTVDPNDEDSYTFSKSGESLETKNIADMTDEEFERYMKESKQGGQDLSLDELTDEEIEQLMNRGWMD